MTRAREAARLIGNNTFRLDSNNAVGFNSTTPDAMFDINSGLTVAGIVTATGGFSGAVTGAATQVTVADESSDTTCFPLFVTAATGDLAPKSGSNLTFNSSTGTLETTNVTVTGDLTVQGTTTTLDTTLQEVDLMNIQANSSTPGLGVTQSGSGDIAKFYDGTSAVFTIADGGGVTVESGVLTLNNNLDMQDNDKILIGAGDDLQIYHDGSHSYIDHQGTGNLYITHGSETMITANADGAVQLRYDNNIKFATKSDGVDITGELQCDSLDVDGAADITGTVTLHGNLDLQDSDQILLGTSDDLQIYHDGSHSRIKDSGTGFLILSGNEVHIQNAATTETCAKFKQDAEVELYYDNSAKLVTKTDGVDITGELQCDSLDVDGNSNLAGDVDFVGDTYSAVWDKSANRLKFNDNAYIALGTGADATLYVNGSHAYFDLHAGIGNFYIRDGTTTRFTFDDGGDFTATGNVTAYSDVTLKENIETIPNALDKVLRLRGVEYDRIDREEHQIGVIAQEIEEVIPEVVITNEEGIKSVAYGNLVGLLIESVKELKAEVNDLKAKLEE